VKLTQVDTEWKMQLKPDDGSWQTVRGNVSRTRPTSSRLAAAAASLVLQQGRPPMKLTDEALKE
jgi:hypothetical protein